MFSVFENTDDVEVSLASSQIVDWGVHATHAEDAWKETRGEGIRVAVLDTGCAHHPDLAPNLLMAMGDDDNGHGTHVAGIIGAADNGIGVVGVAPGSRLCCYKVLPGDGDGIASAVRHATATGVEIIHMSLGTYEECPPLDQAIQIAYAQGVVIVAAAGNKPDAVAWPAAYPEVIAVSALDQSFNRAVFAPLVPNHVALPGVSILSTWPQDQYARLSGTSQAAPILTGIIALLLSKYKPGRDQVHSFVTTNLARMAEKHGDFFYSPDLDKL